MHTSRGDARYLSTCLSLHTQLLGSPMAQNGSGPMMVRVQWDSSSAKEARHVYDYVNRGADSPGSTSFSFQPDAFWGS